MRTHYCGQVNAELAEQHVSLCGWVNKRRDLGGLIFIDLRDRETEEIPGIYLVEGSRIMPVKSVYSSYNK